MEPITAAILAALPALATDVARPALEDAYEGLKAVIRRKWSETGAVTKAITALEKNPTSKAQAEVLEEKIVTAKVDKDAEVIQALHRLIEQMKIDGIGTEPAARIQINISGGTQKGVVGAEKVHIETMTFNSSPKG